MPCYLLFRDIRERLWLLQDGHGYSLILYDLASYYCVY